LGTAAEVLTMCCFFGAAWVRPCCIGMIRVGSYFFFRLGEYGGWDMLFIYALVTKLSESL
jgi:hypothetical protein